MSLKVLLFPFFIIVILILIIGYIKPEISLTLEKRAALKARNDALSKIDTIIKNIQLQNIAIDERRESEAFVQKYLPLSLEEERVLDSINYLAVQSGVVVAGIDIIENTPVQEEAPQITYASASVQAVVDSGVVGQTAPVEPPKRTIESYRAAVKVIGTYASIKDFLFRLNHADRFHKTVSFGIAARKETSEKEVYPTEYLIGSFEADFIYFRPFRVYSVADQPLFQQAKFDFAAVDKLLNHTKHLLPSLEIGNTGKPNPFQ